MKLYNIKAKVMGIEINTQIPGTDEVDASEKFREYVSTECKIIYCTEEYVSPSKPDIFFSMKMGYMDTFLAWSILDFVIKDDDDRNSLVTSRLERVTAEMKHFLDNNTNRIQALPEIGRFMKNLSDTEKKLFAEEIKRRLSKDK